MSTGQGSDVTPDEKTVQTERIKLTATTLNTVGIAVILSGAVLPIISLLYAGEPPKARLWWLLGIWWLGMGVFLHSVARATLGRIAK